MTGNNNDLQTKLELELRRLKNKLAVIIDEMSDYARLKKTNDVEMLDWYTKLREVHDICLLIEFIENLQN